MKRIGKERTRERGYLRPIRKGIFQKGKERKGEKRRREGREQKSKVRIVNKNFSSLKFSKKGVIEAKKERKEDQERE